MPPANDEPRRDDAPSSAPPDAPRARRWLVVLGVLSGLGLVGLVGGAIRGCVRASDAADSFTTALRERRYDDASALATDELRPSVWAAADRRAPSTDRLDALRRIAASTRAARVGGWSGRFDVLCGRLALDGDPGTLVVDTTGWIVVRQVDDAWRVADVGTERTEPELCRPD